MGIKLMIQRYVESGLLFPCIDRRCCKIILFNRPNRKGRNSIGHICPVVVHADGGLIAKQLLQTDRHYMTFLVLQHVRIFPVCS